MNEIKNKDELLNEEIVSKHYLDEDIDELIELLQKVKDSKDTDEVLRNLYNIDNTYNKIRQTKDDFMMYKALSFFF